MRPGDRVRVIRGEHEGRTGAVVDASEGIQKLHGIVRPGRMRDRLEAQLAVPEGCQLVRFDVDSKFPVSVEERDLVADLQDTVMLREYPGTLDSRRRVKLSAYLQSMCELDDAALRRQIDIHAILGKLGEALMAIDQLAGVWSSVGGPDHETIEPLLKRLEWIEVE